MLNYLARLIFDIASGFVPAKRPAALRRGGMCAHYGTSLPSDRSDKTAAINFILASRMFDTR